MAYAVAAVAAAAAAAAAATPVAAADALLQLVDCSPDWGYIEGGQKVLVIYDIAAALAAEDAARTGWEHSCVFGDVHVPAEFVRAGVLRCEAPHAPSGTPGAVPLVLHLREAAGSGGEGEGRLLTSSQQGQFTYRSRPSGLLSDGRLISAADEKEFYLRLLRTIGSVTGAMQPQSDSGGGGGGAGAAATAGAVEKEAMETEQEHTAMRGRKASRDGANGFDGAVYDMDGGSMPSEDGSMGGGSMERDAARGAALDLMVRLVELATSSEVFPAMAALAAPDSDGLTPLHTAAALGFVEVIELLLARGVVAPNAVDAEGCTAMHWASAHGRQEVVAVLLRSGARQQKNNDVSTQAPPYTYPLLDVQGHHLREIAFAFTGPDAARSSAPGEVGEL